jgi:hypothetical protein
MRTAQAADASYSTDNPGKCFGTGASALRVVGVAPLEPQRRFFKSGDVRLGSLAEVPALRVRLGSENG